MDKLTKLAQSLGGVKSQQKILRERIAELEVKHEEGDSRFQKIESRLGEIAFMGRLILLSLWFFYAIFIIGFLWRLL